MNRISFRRQTGPCTDSCRRGVAAVEFALVAPILFLFLCGSIEFARLNMLRNSLENAAYEGARRAIIPGGTAAAATTNAKAALSAIGVTTGQVSVSPSVILASTTNITVTVSLPLKDAGWIFYFSSSSSTMTRSVTLKREPT